MSYRVRTDNFEGPFDILLYLVSRQRVDIGTISIAQIADQYLDEVSNMRFVDLDVASDFLLVASTLLEIKAASLIPHDDDEVDEDIAELAPSEARDLLVERLLEYKKFKNAAIMLEGRAQAQARLHARPFGAPSELTDGLMPDFLRNVSVEMLGAVAAEVFGQRDVELLNSEHIAAKPIPVELHVKSLHSRLMREKHLRFSDVITDTTPAPVVVVTFLAMLELYKRAMVDLHQDQEFGDILIDYIEGSGALVFEEGE